jgi:hypothetical protein
MLKTLVTLLIVPFLYSCQTNLQGQESPLEKKVAYTQVTHTEHHTKRHTKHIRKQQQKIHDRLRRIRERVEKKKQRKRRDGK